MKSASLLQVFNPIYFSFNFAEAALLIHGTTNVYVKKIDYVLQIALNFFDELKEDKPQGKNKKKSTFIF